MADIYQTTDINGQTTGQTIDSQQQTTDIKKQTTRQGTNSQQQTTGQTTDDLEQTTELLELEFEQITEETGYLTIKELEERLGIKRDALYQRMRYLEMKPHKFERRALLDPEQVAILEQLHEHIKRTRKMSGFPKPKSMATGEEEKVAQHKVEVEENTQTHEQTDESVVAQEEQSQALVVAADAKLDLNNQQQLQAQPITEIDDKAYFEQIKKEAADLSFSKQMTVLDMARAYTENPQMLPEDMKQELESAKMAAVSAQPLNQKAFYDPNALTQLVMETL